MSNESNKIKLKLALENLDSLPAMPVIAQKLLALPLDTDAGENELLSLIGQDPQLSAKIISLGNSPVMGLTRKIGTVSDAAMLLGMTRVKSVALGIASMSNLTKLAAGKYFNPQDLWLHSMTIAIVMRTIAQAMPRESRPKEDQIFLAGLLHDIGFMALHHIDAGLSDELHKELQATPSRPILEIELDMLGVTHCYVGAQLARRWNLPADIVTVLGYHHPPYVEELAERSPLVRLVNLAEKLQPDFGINEHTGGLIDMHEWQSLGIAPGDVDDVIALANELAVQTAQSSAAF